MFQVCQEAELLTKPGLQMLTHLIIIGFENSGTTVQSFNFIIYPWLILKKFSVRIVKMVVGVTGLLSGQSMAIGQNVCEDKSESWTAIGLQSSR